MATRLYVPEGWAGDEERRKRAHIPKDIGFATKAERALARREEANRYGVTHAWVTGEAD